MNYEPEKVEADPLKRLSIALRNLADEVRTARRRRRVALVLFLFAVYAAITIHDEHVVHCYPPPDERTQWACNKTFPLHDHPMEGEK